MGVAANCVHFMEAMRVDADSSQPAFTLMEDLRSTLEAGAAPYRLTPFFFRLNLASLLGFAPDLERCAICGAEGGGEFFFVPEEGRIFCPACFQGLEPEQRRHGMRASWHALARLSGARFSLPSQWREEDLSDGEKRLCARLIDCFVRYHLGIGWENGAFRPV